MLLSIYKAIFVSLLIIALMVLKMLYYGM